MITLFCIRPKGFNVGNDVIYLGLQHFVYEAFGELVNLITLPATSRYESQAKAGLTAKTIHEINQYGHGVIVGGGNLYENGELDVNLDALDALEPPLMLFSLSRGRIYNRQGRLVDRTDALPERVIRALDRKANYALARDDATAAYLKRIGCQHDEVGGCPTIFLDRMIGRLPRLPASNGEHALISIRNPALMSVPLWRQSEVYNDVLRIIDFLHKEGYENVRLLCHDHRDVSFAASFPGVDYIYTGDVHTYLAVLRACAINITYRLHAFLPCVAFGVPAIKISYDERAFSLVETVGLGAWNIDMVQTDDLLEKIHNRFERLDELQLLREQAQEQWHELYATLDRTFHEFAHEVRAYREGALTNAPTAK